MPDLRGEKPTTSPPVPTRTSDRRLKILLAEGSSVTVREVLFALGPHHTIDLIDPNPWCQGRFSRFVRRFTRCPAFSHDPAGYLAFLTERLRSESYDVLLPTHEHVYLLSRFRDRLSQLVGLAVPAFDDLNRVLSKAEFARLMYELELPTPATKIVRSREELAEYDVFPCFAKIDYGTAGRGVRRAASRDDLQQIAGEFEQAGWLGRGSEVVLQQEATGIQSVFYAVFANGQMVAWHCLEALRPAAGGWPSCGQSAHHPVVLEQVSRLGAALHWHGALFVDYFYDASTGQPAYIECNPRIQAAYHAQLSGVDLADQLLRVSLGEQVSPHSAGRPGTRFHQGFLMLIDTALRGANRREILAEWWRCRRHREIYADSQDTLTDFRKDWLSILPSLAITTSLLLRPKSAQRMVQKAVGDYAVSFDTAQRIRELDPADLPGMD